MPDPAQRPTGQTVDLDEVRRRLELTGELCGDGQEYINRLYASSRDVPALLADLDAAREALRRVEALLLDIGEVISPTGEWPWEAIEQLPDAVRSVDLRAERMRPVVEAAKARRAAERRDVIDRPITVHDLLARVEEFGPIREAFDAAVDTYETQENTE